MTAERSIAEARRISTDNPPPSDGPWRSLGDLAAKLAADLAKKAAAK